MTCLTCFLKIEVFRFHKLFIIPPNTRQDTALQNTKTNFALQIYSLLSQTGELTVENLIKAASDEDIERKKMIEDYKKKIKNQKK